MIHAAKQHTISFRHAIAGLLWALRTQPNFRIHTALALLAVALGLYVGLSRLEWILLVFVVFWGFATELLNTALEAIGDSITTQWRQEIKIAKDVAAGMMLFVAIGAAVVGILLLGPKLLLRLFG